MRLLRQATSILEVIVIHYTYIVSFVNYMG